MSDRPSCWCCNRELLPGAQKCVEENCGRFQKRPWKWLGPESDLTAVVSLLFAAVSVLGNLWQLVDRNEQQVTIQELHDELEEQGRLQQQAIREATNEVLVLSDNLNIQQLRASQRDDQGTYVVRSARRNHTDVQNHALANENVERRLIKEFSVEIIHSGASSTDSTGTQSGRVRSYKMSEEAYDPLIIEDADNLVGFDVRAGHTIRTVTVRPANGNWIVGVGPIHSESNYRSGHTVNDTVSWSLYGFFYLQRPTDADAQ